MTGSLLVFINVWIGCSVLSVVVTSDSEFNIEIINTLNNLILSVTF